MLICIVRAFFTKQASSQKQLFFYRFGCGLRWYVPSGLKKWMNDCGCQNVVEMTWWEEDVFDEDLNITVACTPSQHSSMRTGIDENKVTQGSRLSIVLFCCYFYVPNYYP